jgi:hypothetical protein
MMTKGTIDVRQIRCESGLSARTSYLETERADLIMA